MSQTAVHEAVQAAGEKVSGLRRDAVGLGTNNATERAIGWWVKARDRTMRTYKPRQSVLNVSRLIAWAASHLKMGGVSLAPVAA